MLTPSDPEITLPPSHFGRTDCLAPEVLGHFRLEFRRLVGACSEPIVVECQWLMTNSFPSEADIDQTGAIVGSVRNAVIDAGRVERQHYRPSGHRHSPNEASPDPSSCTRRRHG